MWLTQTCKILSILGRSVFFHLPYLHKPFAPGFSGCGDCAQRYQASYSDFGKQLDDLASRLAGCGWRGHPYPLLHQGLITFFGVAPATKPWSYVTMVWSSREGLNMTWYHKQHTCRTQDDCHIPRSRRNDAAKGKAAWSIRFARLLVTDVVALCDSFKFRRYGALHGSGNVAEWGLRLPCRRLVHWSNCRVCPLSCHMEQINDIPRIPYPLQRQVQ